MSNIPDGFVEVSLDQFNAIAVTFQSTVRELDGVIRHKSPPNYEVWGIFADKPKRWYLHPDLAKEVA